VRALIIDDHPLFTHGFKLTLSELIPDLDLDSVTSCEESLQLAPDTMEVVFVDLNMPGLSGVKAVQSIRDHFTVATLVVLSGETDPALVRSVIAAGASGFIPKSSSPPIMHSALRLVFSGSIYVPPSLVQGIGLQDEKRLANPESVFDNLSMRQREVFDLLLWGVSNKVIANKLHMSEGTVKSHLSTIYRILDVSNRTEAVLRASRAGYELKTVQLH
jgi:DNA-binding NarL/FixJ family response regulator